MAISREIDHPYFHSDLNERQAKALLAEKEGSGHYLFCPGSDEDDILLVYRARIRGNYEQRTKIYTGQDLDGAGEFLIDFIDRLCGEVFVPKPVMKLYPQLSTQTERDYGVFFAPELLLKVLEHLSLQEAVACRAVSKNWRDLINRNMQFFTNKQNAVNKRKNENMLRTGKYIRETIMNALGVDDDGQGNSSKNLSLNGAMISAPNWFRGAILFDFKCSAGGSTCSIILEENGDLNVIENHGPFELSMKEDIYAALERICTNSSPALLN